MYLDPAAGKVRIIGLAENNSRCVLCQSLTYSGCFALKLRIIELACTRASLLERAVLAIASRSMTAILLPARGSRKSMSCLRAAGPLGGRLPPLPPCLTASPLPCCLAFLHTKVSLDHHSQEKFVSSLAFSHSVVSRKQLSEWLAIYKKHNVQQFP